ncbi:MAG TPA: PIG-L family deacetylase, partial [Dehalococcoidia bacterium]
MTPGGPVAVISPHLDDAVFGCGELLAARPGSVVITIFAGRPPRPAHLTPWDAASGFRPSDDVMARRREEDRAALSRLGARPCWLDFLDAQYAPPPPEAGIAAALEHALAGVAGECYLPLGLFHSDHALAHAAAVHLMHRRPERRWFAYEDAMYRRIAGLLDGRLRQLRSAGVRAEQGSQSDGCLLHEKRRAMACYRSQLRALRTPGRPGYADALAPERYWR